MVSLIGFCGPIGAGKTSAANYLKSAHGFSRVRFAGPLKDMLLVIGLSPREVDGDLKEVPCDLLCGCTPRHAMQMLGTEFGRELIGRDFWVNAWRRQAEGVLKAGARVVANDVRHVNEIEAIRELGGIIVRIERPGIESDAGHSSERQELPVDHELMIRGDLEDLHFSLDYLLKRILKAA